jgi:hypothetical protein
MSNGYYVIGLFNRGDAVYLRKVTVKTVLLPDAALLIPT